MSGESDCKTAYNDMLNSDQIFTEIMETDPSLADALNIGACKTMREEDREKTEVCVGASVGPACMGPKAGNESEYIKATTEGCESAAIQHALNVGVNKTLSCTSNSLSQKSKSASSTIQLIKLKITDIRTSGGDVNIEITQTAETDMNIIDFTSLEVQKEFTNAIQQELESFQEAVQSQQSDSEFGTGNANRSLQQNIAGSFASTGDLNISELVKEAVTSVCTKQGNELEITGIDTRLVDSNGNPIAGRGGDANITLLQESAQKVVIESMTQAIVNSVTNNSVMQKNITTSKVKQENIKKTQANYAAVFVMLTIFFLIVIGCLVLFSVNKLGKKYTLPSTRCACFWTSFVFVILMAAIPLFRQGDLKYFWILSLIFFLLALGLSFGVIGNGSEYIVSPYTNAVNVEINPGEFHLFKEKGEFAQRLLPKQTQQQKAQRQERKARALQTQGTKTRQGQQTGRNTTQGNPVNSV